MKSVNNLIVRMQPLPKELKRICDVDPDFANALKLTHPHRFISLGAVITSYPPNSKDEVIGFYIYDYSPNEGILKQDFIVNIGRMDTSFIIYTGKLPNGSTQYIKHVNEFFKKYPSYDKRDHRPKYEDLPEKIKTFVPRALNLAEKLSWWGVRDLITNKEFNRIDKELTQLGL